MVKRIANKHRNERLLITQQQEKNRLNHVQTYREARLVVGTLLSKLESVDVNKFMVHVGKDTTANRLKQLQQTITDA